MKKAKRLLALLLAAVMCGSLLAACGSGGTQRSGPFTYPMSGDHSITYWCTFNELMSHSYTDMNESPFGKGLIERTGVNIAFQHPPTGGGDEQLSLIMADGDLPDVMEHHWQDYPGGPEKAIEDGNIYALNDIIGQYCPNLKAYLESRPDVDRQCKTDNGNYYMFPFIRGNKELQVTQGLMVRQDWLDELGLEIPITPRLEVRRDGASYASSSDLSAWVRGGESGGIWAEACGQLRNGELALAGGFRLRYTVTGSSFVLEAASEAGNARLHLPVVSAEGEAVDGLGTETVRIHRGGLRRLFNPVGGFQFVPLTAEAGEPLRLHIFMTQEGS